MTIQGSREDQKAANDEALAWQNYVSTPDDMTMAIFVDGSYSSETNGSGYGLVFRRVAPGMSDNGKEVKMRWRIGRNTGVVKAREAEAFGLWQGLRQGKTDLVVFVAKRLDVLRPVTRRAKVILKVYSDHQTSLKVLRAGRHATPVDNADLVYMRLMDAVVQESHDLVGELAEYGVELELQLHWVPSHTKVVAAHTLADKLAKQARKKHGCFAWIEDELVACPASVYLELEEELSAIYNSQPVVRRAKRARISAPGPWLPAKGYEGALEAARLVYRRLKADGHTFGHNQEYVFIGEESGEMWRVALHFLKKEHTRQGP